MGIGSKLLDTSYKPEENISSDFNLYTSFKKIVKCPVKFTNDIIEYCESSEFLNIKLKPLQKLFLETILSKDDNGIQIFNEGCLCVGMRAGKSFTSALLATGMTQMLLQHQSPAEVFGLIGGTRLTAQFIASSEAQAKETAYAAADTIISYRDYWRKYIAYLQEREINEKGKETLFQHNSRSIEFKEQNLALLSLNSSSSAMAGKSSYIAIMDELSRFGMSETNVQTKSETRTAEAVYSTVSRSIFSTNGFGLIITASSPMYEDDYTMKLVKMAGTLYVGSQASAINLLREREPKKIKTMYAMHATTPEFNPDISYELLESEKQKNPFAYSRDYLALPPSAISPYIDRMDLVEQCVHSRPAIATFTTHIFEESITTLQGKESRRYIGKQILIATSDKMKKYFICCDQGEKKDAFVVCMGHGEEVDHTSINGAGKEVVMKKHKVIIDLLEAWEPDKENKVTVSFQNVENIIASIASQYFVQEICYDQWQSTEAIQRFFSLGIHTERIGATLEMYDIAKMLMYSDMVEIPPDEKLLQELRTLNLIKGKKVEHNDQNFKDRSDALIRVIFRVYESSIKDSIQGTDMLPKGAMFLSARNMQGPEFNLQSYGGSMAGSGGGLWGNNSVFGNRDTIVQGNVNPSLDKFK